MGTATSLSWPTTAAERISALSAVGDRARRAGRYDAAWTCLERALALAEGGLAPGDPLLIDVLNRIGVLGKYSGDHERAEAAYGRALQAEQSRIDPRLDTIATLLHNLGGLAHAAERHEEAASSARRGLALRRQLHDRDSTEVAADEAALAAILVDCDELAEALALASHARIVLASEWGEADHDAVAALAVIATVLHRRRDVDGAVVAYAEVLRCKERRLGPVHPELVPTLNNIGVLHAQLGRLDEAKAIYSRALTILDDAGLSDHPYRPRIEANIEQVGRRAGSPA